MGPGVAGGAGVNVISLPSMTGLILAGLDPLAAIHYQIVVMHMLLAATTLSALVAARAMGAAVFEVPRGEPFNTSQSLVTRAPSSTLHH